MTRYQTTCPRCGEVELGEDAMFLSIVDDDAELGPIRGGYGFVCPGCGDGVWREGDDRLGTFTTLLRAGLEPIQSAAERLLRGGATRRSRHRHLPPSA